MLCIGFYASLVCATRGEQSTYADRSSNKFTEHPAGCTFSQQYSMTSDWGQWGYSMDSAPFQVPGVISALATLNRNAYGAAALDEILGRAVWDS